MSSYRYDRLTALDSAFLAFESYDTPMHVATTAIFDAHPLHTAAGGVDIERILEHIQSRLHRIPRYREKIAYVPLENHPVWIDDERFNLHYHVRHTSLPRPGSERQLKRLSARIMSQQLDRGKPLWETWIVEGLEGERMAMISKVHHCMIDGVSGVDLLGVLLSPAPESPAEEPVRWIPRPAPSKFELLRDELLERLRAPALLGVGLATDPVGVFQRARYSLSALSETLAASLHLAPDTPLNLPIGPHRRFDWMAMEIGAIRAIRQRLGGTLNDVVLATVAGAVRRFLERRGVNPRTIDFRTFVPVNVRTREERGSLGNRVAGWIVDLPVAEPNARKRLDKVCRAMAELKHSHQKDGAEVLTELVEWGGTTLLSLAARLATQARPFNLVVTNVPGPPIPLYLLGAQMREVYPMVPLFVSQGLGIALFSYAGRLHWGFNADWDVVPDLHDFVRFVEAAFAELQEAAAMAAPMTSKRGGRRVGRNDAGAGGNGKLVAEHTDATST